MKRLLFALLCLCFAFHATAAAPKILGGPTPGMWWNANESGRGYQVDLQGSIMVVTSYTFAPTGAVVWYLSAGVYNHANGTFEATFDNGENGQCFGCPYRAPTPRPSAGGQMRIVFSDANTGMLYFNGGSTPIKRYLFGYPQKLDFLYGEFLLSSNSSGVIVADWPILINPLSSGGSQYVAGNQDSSSNPAIGTYVASTGTWLILVGAGAYDHYYEVVIMDDRRMIARAWIVPAGADPSGTGVAAVGTRLLMKDEVSLFLGSSAQAPAMSRAAARTAAGTVPGSRGNANDEAAYTAQRGMSQGEAPAHLVKFAREARGLLPQR